MAGNTTLPQAALAVLCSGGAASAKVEPPEAIRPLMAFAAGAMVLLVCGGQLVGNQFGYDRAGFRAYVLSPAPRREILLVELTHDGIHAVGADD